MNVPPPPGRDWQTTRKSIKERGQYLLETGMWCDCRFIVGTEPNQQVLEGHKLFLAMSSPVFEAMLFGGMAEKDPIAVLDVQPDAFKALLEYIYTDTINLSSFDQACGLCYAAKKYMLPHLVEECTKYLCSNLCPKNACRAYEFGKLIDEPILMDKGLNIICNQTQKVVEESSFEESELNTVITMSEQDELDVKSELELFAALQRYSTRHNLNTETSGNNNSNNRPTIRDALMNIRFLTLTPQEFAEAHANSNLLTQTEKFSILMNICSPSSAGPMPEGFSVSILSRKKKLLPNISHSPNLAFGTDERFHCYRKLLSTTECMVKSRSNWLSVCTFSCDKNIVIHGIEVPTKILKGYDPSYMYSLHAHLYDANGSRLELAYIGFTDRVECNSIIEVSFNRTISIQKNKIYKVGVVLVTPGCYPIGTYPDKTISNGVQFTFISQGLSDEDSGRVGDSGRDGLIRSIIFSITNPNISV